MSKKRIPKLEVVALSFTNRCNLSCSHCGYDFLNRDKRKELPVDFFVKVITEAHGLGARSLNITGGEIFLRRECLELASEAIRMGYFVSLESNGTLIAKTDIERLKTFGDRVRIAISLDGITRETHEKVRGKGTFDKTIEVLRTLSRERIPSRVNMVMQVGNLGEVADVTKFAVEELDIGFRILPFILEYGKGACACKTDGVPYEAIEKVMEGFIYPYKRTHPNASISFGLNTAIVPIDIEGHLICPWGKSMIGIGPSGIASLCHVTNNQQEFVFGDLKTQSLTEVWRGSPRLREFREFDADSLKGVCGNCLARPVCRGGCRLNAFASYNDFLAPDPKCQTVYNLGKFPPYALEDSEKDCKYG